MKNNKVHNFSELETYVFKYICISCIVSNKKQIHMSVSRQHEKFLTYLAERTGMDYTNMIRKSIDEFIENHMTRKEIASAMDAEK